MNFNAETRVNEIALSDPGARRILEDAGVDYCCGGGKSLHDACMRANVPAEVILEQLRKNSRKAETGESRWKQAPLAELTGHIRERHHGYVRDVIPRLRGMLAKVREKHGTKHREIEEIERLFGEVARDMQMHMQKEEQILFPFIDALERAASGQGAFEPPFFQTVRNPIYSMMKEHDAAGELVRQIRAASNTYHAPEDACATFQAAYQELEQFEKDLHLHVHLENNILFPRAVELEAAAA
ncbi:MAG: iron-sulfur cluster repair di-iron protein [Acidobacteria bacterium]|nr:iron-sulfur cluster repair di-iron protein [Acidobacteriota bacterium]MBS1864502.1 iron-sulfur cluster repair di-iron protein [Acidobacteriota bacterium]